MKSKDRILKLNNRKILFDFITKNPGIHQRKIIRKIDLSSGTIKYHLNFLVKKGLISKSKIMGYTRFYPSKKIGKTEKEMLSILRQKIPRQILLYLMLGFSVTKANLSKILEKDSKTVDFHLKKLLELNFIEPAKFKDGMMLTNRKETPFYNRTQKGKEKMFRLKDPYMVYHFFVKYKTLYKDDKATTSGMDHLEYIIKGEQPKKYDNLDKAEDRILKAIFDIFPIPWRA